MWQKAETFKITKEILKLVHPKISFADKQHFQQAARFVYPTKIKGKSTWITDCEPELYNR
jgi:hypothetical protein